VIRELRPGLYRWTAVHPAWEPHPEPGSPADWPPEVGSVAYAADDRLVFIDPLVLEGQWDAVDALVERHGLPVATLTTMRFHTRSREAIVERYGAERPRIDQVDIAGVETVPVADADETMVWLPGPGALVPGDRLMGADHGGVCLCPESWLRYMDNGLTHDGLRERLRPLLELPVELVLVSHGEPVLQNGRAAIAAALAP
jgi:hypothetical protein